MKPQNGVDLQHEASQFRQQCHCALSLCTGRSDSKCYGLVDIKWRLLLVLAQYFLKAVCCAEIHVMSVHSTDINNIKSYTMNTNEGGLWLSRRDLAVFGWYAACN